MMQNQAIRNGEVESGTSSSKVDLTRIHPTSSNNLDPTLPATTRLQRNSDVQPKNVAMEASSLKQTSASTAPKASSSDSSEPKINPGIRMTAFRAAILHTASRSFVSSIFSFVQGAAKIRTSCQWSPGAGDEVHINSTSKFSRELGQYALNMAWDDLLWLFNAFDFVLTPIVSDSKSNYYPNHHVNSIPRYILFHPTKGFRKDSTPIELCQIQLQKQKLAELESAGSEYLGNDAKIKKLILPLLQPIPIPMRNDALESYASTEGRSRHSGRTSKGLGTRIARESSTLDGSAVNSKRKVDVGDDSTDASDSPTPKRGRGRPRKARGAGAGAGAGKSADSEEQRESTSQSNETARAPSITSNQRVSINATPSDSFTSNSSSTPLISQSITQSSSSTLKPAASSRPTPGSQIRGEGSKISTDASSPPIKTLDSGDDQASGKFPNPNGIAGSEVEGDDEKEGGTFEPTSSDSAFQIEFLKRTLENDSHLKSQPSSSDLLVASPP